ncbi:MAG: hypothetical protein ABFS41_11035 [Myxococcota bacterium]
MLDVVGHCDGQPLEELDAIDRAGELTSRQAIYRSWLRVLVRLKPKFAPEPTPARDWRSN